MQLFIEERGEKMRIGIANDHRGVMIKQELTKYLESLDYTVVNYGTDTEESVDYPHYAFKVGEAVAKKEIDFGVLICSSGIGMSIACNKVAGVRCAKVNDTWEAEMTRIDNDANVIALGSRLPMESLKEILHVFLTTSHPASERHDRRISLVDHYHV